MAIFLEHTIKRFIGDSTDKKPHIGLHANGVTYTAADLPVGSTLYLADLGIIERWDGTNWRRNPPDMNFDMLLENLQSIRMEIAALRLGMTEAGTCKEVSEEDAREFAVL